jgi:hypothetical protein
MTVAPVAELTPTVPIGVQRDGCHILADRVFLIVPHMDAAEITMFNPLMSATTFGRKPRPTGKPDEFIFRIYTGGVAGVGTADAHASALFDKFQSENGYSGFEMVAREGQWFPSCYDYTVRFRAN